MQEKSDIQLLRDYAEHGHESAFREIVTRYTDLVYSAAVRQVESSAAAGDIAQSVFTDLARKAGALAQGGGAASPSLAGWLHRATRYTALNHLRDTRRRLTNERQAMEQLLINSEPPGNWEQIRPALDEAIDTLGDEDREAVLLRYFKNLDFRAIGQAFGISDDAAQKRVSRALERLREVFTKRGIAAGATGLAVVITANAVQAAPAGLAATLSAVALAGTAVSTSTVIAATKVIAMTTLQKTLITAIIATAVGAGIYEARQAAQLRNQVQTLQQQQVPMTEQIQQLQSNFADATNRLANLLAESAKLNANPHQLELLKLRGEVTILRNELVKRMAASQASNHDSANDEEAPYKRHARLLTQYFEANPNSRIPEMNLLPKDYLQSIYGLAAKLAAQNDPAYHGKQVIDDDLIKLETNEEYRRAASELRSYAEYSVAPMVCNALKSFLQANNGAYPASVSDLQPFFTNSIDAAILQRYEIQSASNFSQIQSKYDSSGRISGSVITPRAAIDADFDHRIIIGPNNYMVGESGSFKQ